MPKKVKKKVVMPNDNDLVKIIKKILNGADLENITMKQVQYIIFLITITTKASFYFTAI